LGSVLAAVIAGIVFFFFFWDAAEAEEPLQWRNAWGIPINYSLPVDNVVYDEVFKVVNQGIVEAVPDLEPEAQEELTKIMLQSNDFISEIISVDFVGNMLDTLLNFMRTPEVQEFIIENNLIPEEVEEVAGTIAQEVQRFKDEVIDNIFGDVYLPLGTMRISALEGLEFLRKIVNPSVNYVFDLTNETPLKLTLYVLFFEEGQHWNTVDTMHDTNFVKFITSGEYNKQPGYINFFDDGGDLKWLEIEAGKTSRAPRMTPAMNGTLRDFIIGTKALAWRWTAVVKGDPGDILGALGEKKEYHVDAKLNIEIQGTNNLDSLFRW
jgi:hypothetical protein